MTTQEERIQELSKSIEKYKDFVSEISKWRLDLAEPISVDTSPEEQIELCFKHGIMAECNLTMARMYGHEKSEEMVGRRLSDFLIPDDPNNRAMLMAFIQSGYRLQDVESVERDRHGEPCYFVNNLVGIIHGNKLEGAWGTQRDIAEPGISKISSRPPR